jgi:hypothetical protein
VRVVLVKRHHAGGAHGGQQVAVGIVRIGHGITQRVTDGARLAKRLLVTRVTALVGLVVLVASPMPAHWH